jgi:uncharacterized damage-inducible protein DinB
MIAEMLTTFETTLQFTEQSVADLSEEQMVQQPIGVPNHATWTLGHIIHSCQGLAAELGAEPWLPDDWESAFGYGSTPSPDLSPYPPKAEMLAVLAESADRLRHTLLTMSESALRQSLPDEMTPTMGHLLLQVVIAHTAFHAGQLAMWRRAIGKESVAVFV